MIQLNYILITDEKVSGDVAKLNAKKDLNKFNFFHTVTFLRLIYK